MRCAAKAEEKVAARLNAAASDSSQAHAAEEESSVGHSPIPAAPVDAGVSGVSPHTDVGVVKRVVRQDGPEVL